MQNQKQLKIGFSLSQTWLNGNAWLRPDSEVDEFFTGDHYVKLAQKAEAAKLDFVFKADALFLNMKSVGGAHGLSSLDPTLLAAIIARETKRIGVITTISTTFNSPYVIARQLQTLNWLSHGRAGWNVVTALDGAYNFGYDEMPPADERYRQAEEFVETVRKLWDSYPHEALIVDRESGVFGDTEKIKPIEHSGEFFKVAGPLNVPSPGYGSMPLLQAGASQSGRDLAGATANAVFLAAPDKESGMEMRLDLRERAASHGRNPDEIAAMPGLHMFLAESREEAYELYRETHGNVPTEQRIASVLSISGLDLNGWALDRRITADDLPPVDHPVRSRTHANMIRRVIEREQPTVGELIERSEVLSAGHWVIIGTPEDAVPEIAEWFEDGAVDGFIAVPGGSVPCVNLFFDRLVPLLVEKGLFRQEYEGETLRDHLGLNG